MDLDRMLAMCRRDQWSIDDLDWSVTPRELPREHEIAIVQYFTDMSGIELLAGALFEVQRERATDPTLEAIFDTFVKDEERHSEVALRLAAHYDVHRYREYRQNPHLERFREPFIEAARSLPPDIANAYITTGELLLDIALLRSLDDFVADEMSHAAMRLINRDESRHIAVDFHMVDYYGSEAYDRWLEAQPTVSVGQHLHRAAVLATFMFHAAPFFRDVFFRPMDLVDPTGRRLLEAFKRIQLLGVRPGPSERPFTVFMQSLQDLYNHPIAGKLLGPAISRIMGLDPRVIRQLYTEEEAARARRMTTDAMAEEALAAKYAN